MNNSITQANQNDKQISKSIKRFFTRFHISSALKAVNAYRKKGIPAVEVFQYLFLLVFSNRSMYMSLITGRNTPGFAKDTVYRFMKMVQINWIRFTTLLASRIIRGAIAPLDSEKRTKVLIIDDSMFERNRSKKAELLAKAYDHANHRYRFGFRMLTLGWSDGSIFVAGDSTLESLLKVSKEVDGAIFIFSDDDLTWCRDEVNGSVRDNVLFEYGLFMGSLDEKRVVIANKNKPKLASDLAGVKYIDANRGEALVKQELKAWLSRIR